MCNGAGRPSGMATFERRVRHHGECHVVQFESRALEREAARGLALAANPDKASEGRKGVAKAGPRSAPMPHCPPSPLTPSPSPPLPRPRSKPATANKTLPTAPLHDQESKKLAKRTEQHHQTKAKHNTNTSPSPLQHRKHSLEHFQSNSGTDRRVRVITVMGSLPLLFLLLISGARFGGGVRLGGNGGGGYQYEDWRLGTATYIRESQGHPLNDGGGACGYGDLDIFRYGRYTAGLSGALFDKGSACGGCYELRCVNNILWCLRGSPTVVVTATDFCPPNFGLADDFGGWCNFPKEHLEMTEAAFLRVAKAKADIVQVQFRRVSCDRAGGIRFTITGGANFLQVLITNVAADGEVDAVKVKGSKTGWIPMGRNWGQNWQCDADLRGQPLSFEVTGGKGRTITMYNVAPSDWMFAQTFAGKQFVQ